MTARRIAFAGAISVLAFTLLSGPISMAVVAAVHPQPAWHGAAGFVADFHPIQIVPYVAGVALIVGFVLLVVGLHGMAPPALRLRTTAALVAVTVYAAIVGINYVVQMTFVPGLATSYTDADAPVLAALTMANPRSLGWTLEMWGYAASGVATWLVAPILVRGARGRTAALGFVLNGPVSVAGALITVVTPGWVVTGPGLIAFAAWNLLVIAMMALAAIELAARPA